MAFDVRMNLATGDWEFNGLRDLAGVEAEQLIQQRVHVRLKVIRGTFMYDRTGTLGSRLVNLLNLDVPHGVEQIESIIREALAPMQDITITGITVNYAGDKSQNHPVLDPRMVKATIEYTIVSETADIIPISESIFTTDIILPV